MNPHIELVKKWLADNESVTLEELESNVADAYLAAGAAADAMAVWDTDLAAGDADDAAYWAYCAADLDAARAAYLADLAADAAVWDTDKAEHYKQCAIEAIARYEELTK